MRCEEQVLWVRAQTVQCYVPRCSTCSPRPYIQPTSCSVRNVLTDHHSRGYRMTTCRLWLIFANDRDYYCVLFTLCEIITNIKHVLPARLINIHIFSTISSIWEYIMLPSRHFHSVYICWQKYALLPNIQFQLSPVQVLLKILRVVFPLQSNLGFTIQFRSRDIEGSSMFVVKTCPNVWTFRFRFFGQSGSVLQLDPRKDRYCISCMSVTT